jgi:hypothetical protein
MLRVVNLPIKTKLLPMRKLFYILLITTFTLQIFAQNTVFSPSIRLQNKENVRSIIGSNDSMVYVLKRQNPLFSATKFEIDVFNTSLEKINTIPIELPFSESNANINIKQIFVNNNTPYVYYEIDNRNSRQLSAMIYDYSRSASIVLASMGYEKTNRPPEFTISSDSSKLLLVAQAPYDRYVNETYEVYLFDETMQLIWKERLELPYPSKNFTLEKIKLHNNNVFFLANTNSEKSFENAEKFILMRYDNATKSIKEFELGLTGKWITSATFEIAPNNKLYVGGFYSNDKSFSIAGTFFLSIDLATNSTTDKSLKAFSENFMSEFLPPRRVKKGAELPSFYFDHFIIKPNGGAIFVAEQYIKSISNFNDIHSGFYNLNTVYYYNDIIVVSVDEEGQIEWNKKISKKQYSVNDYGYFSSYALNYLNNNVYIYFNDHPKNNNSKNREQNLRYMNFPQRSVITEVVVTETGMVSYKELKNEKNNLILRPKLSYKTHNNKLIMLMEKSKFYGLIKLSH